MNKNEIVKNIEDIILYRTGKTIKEVSPVAKYEALSIVIMDELKSNWAKTIESNKDKKNAYYFSAEFLIGRSLGNNLLNLGIYDEIREVLDELNISLATLEEMEEDPALGNGGLGRLAACFMESAATEGLPLQGYGVRYSQGIFKQYFSEGFQREEGDDWTALSDIWSLRRFADSKVVNFKDQKV